LPSQWGVAVAASPVRPTRTKAKLKLAAAEHMVKLEQSPERVKSLFQYPRGKYAA
jgi:hypothetical protein